MGEPASPTSTGDAETALLEKELESLRTDPKLTNDPKVVQALQQCLLYMSSNSSDHWYCPKAPRGVPEICTFSLRVHGYAKGSEWKAALWKVLTGCSDCVFGYMKARVRSDETYLSSHSNKAISSFNKLIDTWERDNILVVLKRFDDLARAPSPLVYLTLSNINVISDSTVLDLFSERPPGQAFSDWPKEAPPGLLLLLAHEGQNVRIWARQQAGNSVPFVRLPKLSPHVMVLISLARKLRSKDDAGSNLPHILNLVDTSRVLEPPALWRAFHPVVQLVAGPHALPTLKDLGGVDFWQLILGHLHDRGEHFPYVFRCFISMLNAYGEPLWSNLPEELPQVKIDALKDNPAYDQLIERDPRSDWFRWYEPYLMSVWNIPSVFSGALDRMMTFMGEDMQHQRVPVDVRAMIIQELASILSAVYDRATDQPSSRNIPLLIRRMSSHCKLFMSVAFDRKHRDPSWSQARSDVRQLLLKIFKFDARRASSLVSRLSSVKRAGESAVRSDLGHGSFAVHTDVWTKMYEALPSDDADALGLLLDAIATSAQLQDTLRSSVFKLGTRGNSSVDLRETFSIEVENYQKSMHDMRHGFASSISVFLAKGTGVHALAQNDERMAHVVSIVFSPSQGLSEAALEVAMQLYDVDGRDQCLRAYFEKHPIAAFNGMFSFLKNAEDSIAKNLEACDVSRSTVLCLTDVIDTLAAKPNGLLFRQTYGTELDLPKVIGDTWANMCSIIGEIFKATPTWSTYLIDETDMMLSWMRDALIFARDLFAEYDVFNEAACNTLQLSQTTASPRKSRDNSKPGKAMIEQSSNVLNEMVKWLRLRDIELLHQAVSLVQLLLAVFERHGAQPPELALAKLSKMATHVPRGVDNELSLSREQAADIGEAIAPFVPDGDLEAKRSGSPQSASRSGPKFNHPNKQLSSAPVELSDDDEVEFLGSSKSAGKTSKTSRSQNVYELLKMASGKSRPTQQRMQVDVTPAVRRPVASSSKSVASSDGVKRGIMKVSGKTSSAIGLRRLQEIKLATAAQAQSLPYTGVGSSSKGLGGQTSNVVPLPKPSAAREPPHDLSSEEESGDEEGSGLNALAKAQRSPVISKPQKSRQVVLIDSAVSNTVRQKLDERTAARRTQLRLKPDLTPLHRLILSWNYDSPGDDPPNADISRVKHIPDSFPTSEEYLTVFQPLLTLECWSQLIKSKDENPVELVWAIAQKQYVDAWLDIEMTITDPIPPKWYLAETDIVLLRQMGGPRSSILGKTQRYKAGNQGISASIRLLPHGSDMGLHIGATWKLSKVFSLSTIHREFAALMSLPFYDLFEDILRPAPVKPPAAVEGRITNVMKTHRVNEPQARAILGSLATHGFALIQGPPGTGKTSTICGLAGEFLANRSSGGAPIIPGRTAPSAPPRKLLVCAPSNAAIDEVARRLRDGIRDPSGARFIPKIVRIGNEASLNVSVKDISLDMLVEVKMNRINNSKSNLTQEISVIRTELGIINAERNAKLELFHATEGNSGLRMIIDMEIKALNAKRSALNHRLNQTRDRQTDTNRAMDANKRRFRQEVLREAEIICSTLSGAGHESLEEFDFETVVIDEAAQSVELSSLIPLKYRCRRCIMVGDPQQLAPTVISATATKFNYQQSLFARIQKHRPEAVHLLSIQYRMHPDISVLPSKVFYEGRLLDGPDMAEKTRQNWHMDPMFPPYRFFDVAQGREESHGAHSLLNKSEADMILSLYVRLSRQFSRDGELDSRIGIVTMYRGQLTEIKTRFQRKFGNQILGKVDFNTVDGFQGQEKDIIILSCVRAGPGVNNVGFLADSRRMNVSLTRARSSLYVLGHCATLERSDPMWKQIVGDARERGCLVTNVDATTFSSTFSVPDSAPVTSTSKPKPRKSALISGEVSANTVDNTLSQSSAPLVALGRHRNPSGEVESRKPLPRKLDPEAMTEVVEAGPSTAPLRIRPIVRPPQKAEPTLFIPKKNLKRKPPPSVDTGGSDVKRRIIEETNLSKQ